MFSSAVRSVLQTILGVWIFSDLLNVNRIMSILLILAGSTLYTYFKSRPVMATVKAEEVRDAKSAVASGMDLEKGEKRIA